MRKLAERAIAIEMKEGRSSGATFPAGFPVGEKLRLHLAALTGVGGFRTLTMRALVLAQSEVSWLSAMHVDADGSLGGPAELDTKIDPEQILEGRVVVLAHLLGLLVAFIGEDLTMRLTVEVWPKLSFGGLDSGRRQR